jgi:hypothetical protein
MAKVKTIFTHLGQYGLKKTGDEYETNDIHAAELKRNGLVTSDIDAAPKVEGVKITTNVKDTGVTTTSIKGDEDKKIVSVSKAQLEEEIKVANKKAKNGKV